MSEQRTRTVKSSDRWNAPTRMNDGVPVIATQARDGGLDIIAVWRHQCSYTGDRIIEQRIETGATIDLIPDCDGKDCGIVYVFAIVAAPVTLAISGIVTGIKVSRSDDRFVTKVQPLPLRHGQCDSAAARARLVVTPHTGEPQHVVTDDAGRAHVEHVTAASVQLAP